MQFVNLHKWQNALCDLARVMIRVRVRIRIRARVTVRVRLGVKIRVRVRFKSVICKLCMRNFKTVQHILQIAQTAKSLTTLLLRILLLFPTTTHKLSSWTLSVSNLSGVSSLRKQCRASKTRPSSSDSRYFCSSSRNFIF